MPLWKIIKTRINYKSIYLHQQPVLINTGATNNKTTGVIYFFQVASASLWTNQDMCITKPRYTHTHDLTTGNPHDVSLRADALRLPQFILIFTNKEAKKTKTFLGS